MDSSLLIDSLPEKFDFYHLGSVHKDAEIAGQELRLSADDQLGIAFALQGEIRGIILMLVDRDLNVDSYLEMGNVLASQWADAIAKKTSAEIMITPPRVLEGPKLERILDFAVSSEQRILFQSYSHVQGSQIVKLQTLILPHWPEEKPYA